jgi:hypothetical protein
VLVTLAAVTVAPQEPAAAALQTSGANGVISTVAGGVGGPDKATTVSLSGGVLNSMYPLGLAVSHGAFYLADSATVREVSAAGWLTTPAGAGEPVR